MVALQHFYVVAERGHLKVKVTFDGTNKAFEDFQFGTANQMTDTAKAGKGEAKQEASSATVTIIGGGRR